MPTPQADSRSKTVFQTAMLDAAITLFAAWLIIWTGGCGSTGTASGTSIVISNAIAGNVAASSVTIAWTTNAAATSQVEYGPTANYGTLSPLDSTAVMSHSVALSGLQSATLYHFRVRSGNVVSGDFTFTTGTAGAPTISEVNTSPTISTVFISWTTDQDSDSQVEYGATSSYGQTSALDPTLTKSHTASIIGLSTATTYHFRVMSRNAVGMRVVGSDNTFATLNLIPGLYQVGWTPLPGAELDLPGICPSDASIQLIEGCKAVIHDWSGGVFRTATEQLIIWGGGHSGYGGNEIYAVNLNANPATLTRINDPTTPGVGNCGNLTSGGSCVAGLPPLNPAGSCSENPAAVAPNSRHAYGGMAYIPSGSNADRMMIYGGSHACGPGNGGTDWWIYNFGGNSWVRVNPTDDGSGLPSGTTVGSVVMDWDPVTQRVYLMDDMSFGFYNPATNTYHTFTSFTHNLRQYGTIDPSRRLLVVFNQGTIFHANLDSGTVTEITNATGCAQATGNFYSGMTYDSRRNVIVVWPNAGNAVYDYDASAKQCTQHVFVGGPPDSAHQGSPGTTNGTYGRFRYDSNRDVFVLVNDWDIPAYVLKLP